MRLPPVRSGTERRFDKGLEKILKMNPIVHQILKERIADVLDSPRHGTGDPHQLHGYRPRVVWARRIVGKHRLIYEIKKDCIIFISCYGHYRDH
jgi:Txe/YoeB family toxin of Txe-Axe toxin-antitoxin module